MQKIAIMLGVRQTTTHSALTETHELPCQLLDPEVIGATEFSWALPHSLAALIGCLASSALRLLGCSLTVMPEAMYL